MPQKMTQVRRKQEFSQISESRIPDGESCLKEWNSSPGWVYATQMPLTRMKRVYDFSVRRLKSIKQVFQLFKVIDNDLSAPDIDQFFGFKIA